VRGSIVPDSAGVVRIEREARGTVIISLAARRRLSVSFFPHVEEIQISLFIMRLQPFFSSPRRNRNGLSPLLWP
jgi:hypothetical protein